MTVLCAVLIALSTLGAPRPASLAISVDAPVGFPEPRKDADLSNGTDPVRTTALRGIASWYPVPGLVAAAGPRLRAALGHWRGSTVTVCASQCVQVRLTDFCACYRGSRHERLLDLSRSAFAQLADPSRGLVKVRVLLLAPPATDAIR